MAGPTTASPSLAQDGWRFVDAALDSLERLADADIAPEQFAQQLLAQLAPLGLSAAALWSADPGDLADALLRPGRPSEDECSS